MKQKIIEGLVKGPFKDEQEFKMACVRAFKKIESGAFFFCIETDATEPGFPDVLCLSTEYISQTFEFKYVGEDGMIRFQKAQPLWYKRHASLETDILIWDSRCSRVYAVTAADVVAERKLSIRCESPNIETRVITWPKRARRS